MCQPIAQFNTCVIIFPLIHVFLVLIGIHECPLVLGQLIVGGIDDAGAGLVAILINVFRVEGHIEVREVARVLALLVGLGAKDAICTPVFHILDAEIDIGLRAGIRVHLVGLHYLIHHERLQEGVLPGVVLGHEVLDLIDHQTVAIAHRSGLENEGDTGLGRQGGVCTKVIACAIELIGSHVQEIHGLISQECASSTVIRGAFALRHGGDAQHRGKSQEKILFHKVNDCMSVLCYNSYSSITKL